MYTELGLFIDGKWTNGGGRKSEPVINPVNEKPLADLPHASKSDLDYINNRTVRSDIRILFSTGMSVLRSFGRNWRTSV